ncbi:hypothetical protein [Microbacterium sp.]|uniref:hypothetical protein n=1 Tax=Microbacterium sp. TaxID=51671 RepID=UPI0037C5CB37
MAENSPWRVNDVVTYERMREAASALTALLLQAIDRDPRHADEVRREIIERRREVLSTDGYDRASVVALSERIDARIRELSGAAS